MLLNLDLRFNVNFHFIGYLHFFSFTIITVIRKNLYDAQQVNRRFISINSFSSKIRKEEF